MTTAEKIALSAVLAILTSPAWLFAGACFIDHCLAPEIPYNFEGFCPDTPDAE